MLIDFNHALPSHFGECSANRLDGHAHKICYVGAIYRQLDQVWISTPKSVLARKYYQEGCEPLGRASLTDACKMIAGCIEAQPKPLHRA